MNDSGLALAFTAGMVATVNPCGFAMLPAYLSFFIGLEDRSDDARAGVWRALAVGAAVSAGFLVVFGLLGVVLQPVLQTIQSQLWWVTIVIGVLLIGLGIAMLRGFEPVLSLPKMQKGTKGRELTSMFLFGVSYAVSSLSCTIPVFIATVATTFRTSDFASGMAVFLAYAAGMALVLMTLTLALALARQGIVRRMRGFLPYVGRVSGVLLLVAGLYLTYYGWYEAQVTGSGTPAFSGPFDVVNGINTSLSNWVRSVGALRIGLALLTAIVLAVVVANAWRGSRRRTRSS